MNWSLAKSGFKSFLKLEKSLSPNSIESYLHDLDKLIQFIDLSEKKYLPNEISSSFLKEFLKYLTELGLNPRSQARIISGLKAFFKYLLIEDIISVSPAELIESPRLGRKLPDTLDLQEINKIIEAIDLSTPEGFRNMVMLETLYSCGLRVTELINLKISNILFSMEFIRVIGKGNKERLVPIGSKALKGLKTYIEEVRVHVNVKAGSKDHVFLNKRGAALSRVMIFIIIKNLALKIGLNKKISPHTFRHSFASHMVEAGADLRAVQAMLGHESITTTEIYTHLDREFLKSTIFQYHPRS